METEKTSSYYWRMAKSWLKEMEVDARNRDLESLKVHYKDFGEALSIAKIAKKNGD